MRQGIILLIWMGILLSGCLKVDKIKSECLNSLLTEMDMIEYNSQEIGCKYFLELYHFQNKQVFLLENHCVDMISEPFDCEENIISCDSFHDRAKRIGIVGIEK